MVDGMVPDEMLVSILKTSGKAVCIGTRYFIQNTSRMNNNHSTINTITLRTWYVINALEHIEFVHGVFLDVCKHSIISTIKLYHFDLNITE